MESGVVRWGCVLGAAMRYVIRDFTLGGLREDADRPAYLEHSTLRTREDAARLWLERAVYNACEAQALLDTRMAHKAMDWANKWSAKLGSQSYDIGDHRVDIVVTKGGVKV